MTSHSNSYNEHECGGGHVSVEILHGGRDTIEANRELLLGSLWGPLSARAVYWDQKQNTTPDVYSDIQ